MGGCLLRSPRWTRRSCPRAYSRPGAARGAAEDYRAGPQDVAQDEQDADQLIDVPTLALWGADFPAVGRLFDVLEIWRGMAHDVRGVALPDCWHLPHEERPADVNRAMLDFLAPWHG